MLLFRSGTSEVWELPLSGTPAWRLLSTTNAPYVGGRFALAYDPVRDRALSKAVLEAFQLNVRETG